MPPSQPLRVGVVGVRYAALVHIPALQSEGFEVAAVCARREESAREAAERFGIPRALTDYRDLVAMDDVDVVVIASPPNQHHAMALAALQAGKHLLCEKPFTTTVPEAHELWQAAEASGRTAMLGHEFRFAPGRARVKELLDEGYVGPLQVATVRLLNGTRIGREGRPYSAGDDAADQGGGLLWSQGSHYVDCLMHWFGDVASVAGRVFTHLPHRAGPDGQTINATADDAFEATLTFAAGGWASIVMSQVAAFGPGGRIEVYGRDGTLVTPQAANTPNPPAHGEVLGARVGAGGLQPLPIPERLQPFEDDRDMRLLPTRLLLREFRRGVETGTSPSPNFHDGYRLQRVLQAVRDSSASGQVVHLA